MRDSISRFLLAHFPSSFAAIVSDPDRPSSATATTSFREKAMSFWEHLDELRSTLIKSVVVFVVFAGLIACYLTEFRSVLMWPFEHATAKYPELTIELGTATMLEGFNVLVQTCVFGGLMLALPFILFFIAQFVAPALTPQEMKAVLPMCLSAGVLFLAGAAFGFFILVPSAVQVMIEINLGMDLVFRWSVGSYYTILTRTVLGIGAAFQLPLVIVLLVWLGLATTAFLRHHRRHAIVLIFVASAVITPTGDAFMQTLFALPLYVLFELAIMVGVRVEKRRERGSGAVLVALLALLSGSQLRLPSLSPAPRA